MTRFYPRFDFLEDSDESSKAEAKEQLLATMKQLEEAFEQCSKGKSFFGGDNIGYVDIALGSHVGWIKAFEKIAGSKFLDETKTPLLTRWAACFLSADSVKGVIPEADELVEFAKTIAAARRHSPPPS
ncbi:hypothetical protein HPP92_025907 [Vanilla planifolia]|uniref:GST C-terminal domain-containing protein n=1 Tax=Vanilla planifolia TaxID=51239 RepID=A0A835PGJ2_VANPL|nr:hypothetical protein HPP92_025907 [Vanilla planifolia]